MNNKTSRLILATIALPCLMTSFAAAFAFSTVTVRNNLKTVPRTSSSSRLVLYSTSRKNSRGRKAEAKRLGEAIIPKELNWENYDFSFNPKQDTRFGNGSVVASGQQLDVDEEAREDRVTAQKLKEENNAYFQLAPEMIAAATKVLEPYINDDRLERVSAVLKQRTKRSKFLFENVSNECCVVVHH